MCLFAFVSALGSHEMGRHKLPIIISISAALAAAAFISRSNLPQQLRKKVLTNKQTNLDMFVVLIFFCFLSNRLLFAQISDLVEGYGSCRFQNILSIANVLFALFACVLSLLIACFQACLLVARPRGLTFTWWGCYSVRVSIFVSMALSTVFHSINSPDNSPFSHSVLPVLSLPYWSFQLYVSLRSALM